VSLPKGAIWQRLRQQLLSSIPAGVNLVYRSPQTLSQWQSGGAYVVQKTSSKQFTLVSASVDIGGALLSEAEFLLDHAAEHQAYLSTELRSAAWVSLAWQVTGFYYWAFFLAMAVTRMMGDTVWFVDAKLAAQLAKLAPANSPRPGAGTFRLLCGPVLSATDRELVLKKSGGRLHEQLWKSWSSLVDTLLAAVPQSPADPREHRLFLALQRAARLLGQEWPSSLRNLVNYKPGFGYATVRRANVLESFKYINVAGAYDADELLTHLEGSVVALTRGTVEEQPKMAARALVGFTFVLHAIARELHRELIDRHGIDQRWRNDRSRFMRDRGLLLEGQEWPC
jgi:hypothetical protein